MGGAHTETKLANERPARSRISNFGVGGAAGWDQTANMPPGGAAARGQPMAAGQAPGHQQFTDPTIGRLLDVLRQFE
jgi:Zn-dependent M32 family carboxypeptidase